MTITEQLITSWLRLIPVSPKEVGGLGGKELSQDFRFPDESQQIHSNALDTSIRLFLIKVYSIHYQDVGRAILRAHFRPCRHNVASERAFGPGQGRLTSCSTAPSPHSHHQSETNAARDRKGRALRSLH